MSSAAQVVGASPTPEYLTLPEQGMWVGLATGFSLLWASIATELARTYWGFEPNPLPGGSGFAILGVVAAALWFAFVFNVDALRQSIAKVTRRRSELLAATLRRTGAGRLYAEKRHGIGVALLFLLVVLCVGLLGWYTLGSEGPAHSPFADALLAVVLLSPFISNRWFTALAVLPVVLSAFVVVAFLEPVIYPGHEAASPDLLHVLNTCVTTAVAVLIAVAIKYSEQQPPEGATAD